MANLKEPIEIMKKLHNNLLNYIENNDQIEENFENLRILFNQYKIEDNHYLLNSVLHIVTEIANNHSRCYNFFERLEKIILLYKDSIEAQFSKTQIFSIFKSNKRLLLFIIEEKMIPIDEYFFKAITTKKYKKMNYDKYFKPEIQSFYDKEKDDTKSQQREKNDDDKEEEKLPEDFFENRKIGENNNSLCKLIQKDSIKEFITYVKKNDINLNSTIETSIFETNSFLLEKNPTLIEYASFFGSVQIFKYLTSNKVKVEPSLMIYAIHCNNQEQIDLIIENDIKSKDNQKDQNNKEENNDKIFNICFNETIKCHHIDLSTYIQNNYLNSKNDELSFDSVMQGIKYHNFAFIDSYFIGQSSFAALCQYNYPLFVDSLLKSTYIDVNNVTVYMLYILNTILTMFVFLI